MMMKKGTLKFVSIGMTLLIVLCFMTPSAGSEEKPTASADVAFLTKYIWRGFELSNGSFVIEPDLGISYRGFSFGLWGNLDMDYDDGDPSTDGYTKWTETDMTISYEKTFGPATVGLGYIYYALDGTEDSKEIYGTVAFDVFLSPTLTIYREISHAQAWYFNLGLSYSIDLPKDLTLDLSGSAGYYLSENDSFVEIDNNLMPTTNRYSDFQDGVLSASLPIPFAVYFTVTPTLSYSFPLSQAADNLITSLSYSNESSFLYGGVILSMSF
jgi:uncharacterized protein (TIGR02001 family)